MKYFFIPIQGIERDYNITNQFKNNNKMKKIFFVLCMFLSVNMFAKLPVADFENETGGITVAKADTCWQGADEPSLGLHL